MSKYKNTIIAIMLGCILTMSIGYALLSKNLNVQGTAKVGSTWSVKITDITSKATGAATNKVVPSHTDTTATFNTDLVNPGDKMEYTVTVSNLGTLDAIIESVNLNAEENPAINYTITGIERGYTLTKDESIKFKVTVEYNPDTTTQPEKLSATATVTINAVQLHGSNITPVEPPQEPSVMVNQLAVSSSHIRVDTVLTAVNPTKIEYSSDDGETWLDAGTSTKYTFYSLSANTPYLVKARVTNDDGSIITSESASIKTAESTSSTGSTGTIKPMGPEIMLLEIVEQTTDTISFKAIAEPNSYGGAAREYRVNCSNGYYGTWRSMERPETNTISNTGYWAGSCTLQARVAANTIYSAGPAKSVPFEVSE